MENQLRWLGHMCKMLDNNFSKRCSKKIKKRTANNKMNKER